MANTVPQGLINYIETKVKCRHLKRLTCKGTLRQVFYQSLLTGDTVSHVSIFDSALTNAPLPLLSGSTLPPSLSLCE
jgi:hypothetical protein